MRHQTLACRSLRVRVDSVSGTASFPEALGKYNDLLPGRQAIPGQKEGYTPMVIAIVAMRDRNFFTLVNLLRFASP
jgi:hypothetical protein